MELLHQNPLSCSESIYLGTPVPNIGPVSLIIPPVKFRLSARVDTGAENQIDTLARPLTPLGTQLWAKLPIKPIC